MIALDIVPSQVSSVLNKVPESYGKEALPCVLFPLGFHVSATIKEKNWRGECHYLLHKNNFILD